MYQYKIAVIIPFYNVEKYIGACLNSVINQTFNDIQIILVNDCSTDKSLDIAYQYQKKDKRIMIINLDHNIGSAGARNCGLSHVDAKYIHFLDADDYLTKDCYQTLYDYTTANQLDLTIFNYYKIKDRSGAEPQRHKFSDDLMAGKIYRGVSDKKSLIRGKVSITIWNKLYSTSLIKGHNLRFVSGLIYDDITWFWQTLFFANTIGVLDDCLYYYVLRNSGSVTTINYSVDKQIHLIKAMTLTYQYMYNHKHTTDFGYIFIRKMLKTYSRKIRSFNGELSTQFINAVKVSFNDMIVIREDIGWRLYLRYQLFSVMPIFLVKFLVVIRLL